MKKRLTAVAATALVGAALMTGCFTPETPDVEAPVFSDAAATLSLSGAIDKKSEANRISPDLFGLFLEDINYASFALDDNLLINSSFENRQSLSDGKLHGWSADGAQLSCVQGGGVLSGNGAFQNADGTFVNEDHLCFRASEVNATLKNSGHAIVGMAVEKGVNYTFSAFIKDYTGKITLSVTDGTKVYASGEIEPSGAGWVKYRTTLTATESASKNLYFEMKFASAGTAYLDNVMLETQDVNEETGIKSYLYEAIEALSPKFFRFPGGCIIEGKAGARDEYYDWKNSIGAVAAQDGDTVPAFTYTLNEDGRTEQVTSYGEQATRTYNTDIWAGSVYYQMEYGLGFYEYFLLCEELGAKAIPIVNCGLSCMVQDGGGHALNGRHGNGVEDFIQDAIDLIAFAKGDPASSDANEAYWAQVRVNMGHPEPFAMDYIGIGNEQWGTYYKNYYEKVLVALTEKAQENDLYASVRPIVGNCTMMVHCEDPGEHRLGEAQKAADDFVNMRNGNANNTVNMYRIADYGVVDQHYYVNYTDLFYNHDIYDDYARPADDPNGYYDVFVGEYAANTNTVRSSGGSVVNIDVTNFENGSTSNLVNALSEAAMMTGFERNGDIVKLAAYAPMFGHLTPGARQWQVDMMYFDNTSLLRTPSYYVQQLFMQNSGDYKVASELTFASGSELTVTFKGRTAASEASRTVDQLYYVTSADEETGDILIKLVNAGETSVKLNVELGELKRVKLAGIADVHEVTGLAYTDENELGMEAVQARPEYTIGAFTKGNSFGYEVKALSVTAIRVRTR